MQPTIVHRLTLMLTLLLLAGPAAAEITIDRVEGDRLRMSASGERNQDLLIALGREMGFTAVVEDDVWAATKRDFDRTGNAETLLRILLQGTSRVIAYQTIASSVADTTAADRVSQVTVLGPSSEPVPTVPATNVASYKPPAIGRTTEQQSSSLPAAETSNTRELAISDMLRSRAQPGLVSPDPTESADIHGSASSSAPVGAAADQQQVLRELTAQAQRDVLQLAQALRQAEAALKP